MSWISYWNYFQRLITIKCVEVNAPAYTSALYITCHRLHKRDLGSSSCGMPKTDIGKCANLKQNLHLRKPMVRCWVACILRQSGMPSGHRGCMVSTRLSLPRSASGTQQEQRQLQGAVSSSNESNVKSNIQICKDALLMWVVSWTVGSS